MVIRAKILGYCMGVRKAVNLALKAYEKYPNHAIYTLGPLIHNKNAIEMLKGKGINILVEDDIPTLKDSAMPTVVIIRAHGTSDAIKEELLRVGSTIIDATCPRVLANQRRIHEYAKKGYAIIIVGDKSHGEVFALEGSVPNNSSCFVLQNALEAKAMLKSTSFRNQKAIVISQTTITKDEYEEVSSVIQSSIEDVLVFNTICPATLERQTALCELYNQVDGLIIIGGKNSANTERLYQIALGLNEEKGIKKPVCHIENADEIPSVFFALEKVGISAGASTPDNVISSIENQLQTGGKA